jgi:hypothetical protein
MKILLIDHDFGAAAVASLCVTNAQTYAKNGEKIFQKFPLSVKVSHDAAATQHA